MSEIKQEIEQEKVVENDEQLTVHDIQPESNQSSIPQSAWKRRLDTILEYNQRSFSVGLKETIRLFSLGLRLFKYVYREKRAGRQPAFDPLNEIKISDGQGVSVGGIGSGSITRGWRGDFCRWSLVPGRPRYRTVEADQFSVFIQRENLPPVSKVLATHLKPKHLKTWDFGLKGDKSHYHALFPRAWTVYEEPDPLLKMTSMQFSPFIAGNYEESSFPVGVFVWDIENLDDSSVDVSLMFSFQNGTGGGSDVLGDLLNTPFRKETTSGKGIFGVEMKHSTTCRISNTEKRLVVRDPLTFVIAAEVEEGAVTTHATAWNPHGNGDEIWKRFAADGTLEDVQTVSNPTKRGEHTASAIAVKQHIGPHQKKQIVFVLSWDSPIARLGGGRGYYRRHTKFYGRDGEAAIRLACDAVDKWQQWEQAVINWQEVFLRQKLQRPKIPDWYHTALFNELYYLVDGGSIWTAGDAGGGIAVSVRENGVEEPVDHKVDPPKIDCQEVTTPEIGHFAYLESHEYLMFNTYDVHFYAGFALIQLWPELELSLQRDLARITTAEYTDEVVFCGDGRRSAKKVKAMAPHDVGSPSGDPWHDPNAYPVQDVNRWKDLNSKLILQTYRDYLATKDVQFLRDMLPALKAAFEKLLEFDKDGDGMIENEGFPDQTYDAWSVNGISAYCGGLWIATVAAMREIAKLENEAEEEVGRYTDILDRAKLAYHNALWNGSYYNYDNSKTNISRTIMADQLAGQWYSRACDLGSIVDEESARTALKTIFDYNVMRVNGGNSGAMNGMRPSGRVDYASLQSSEIWTGTSYGLAASLLQEGLIEEGFRTAYGVYKGTYETYGYWFQTPESWDEHGRFRGLGYMRPLSVWSLQWAIDRIVPTSKLS
eukprot:TRINITY_DN7323_c0_g1_i1.p1 TRINITY_DN7323_c0_g1~~TRINITY_DN7323_c0_g1_i1.p1  ORF type:complete len:879 (+),score=168.96 TRINITY_DN7323_c0_g1_i1:63-2699(+)